MEVTTLANATELLTHARCLILPTRIENCPVPFHSDYFNAYQLWKSIWSKTLQTESKIKEPEVLYSDNFLLQDEAVCLFDGDEIIAVIMLKWLDLTLAAHCDLSYFAAYPVEVLKKLSLESPQVVTVGGLVIKESWRKHVVGFGVSEIIIGATIKRFLETPAQALITLTRNNRSVHKIFYRYGGHPLCQNILSHGVEADIIAVYKDNLLFSQCFDEAKLWLESVWDKRIYAGRKDGNI